MTGDYHGHDSITAESFFDKMARENSHRKTPELDKLQQYLDRMGVNYERVDEEPSRFSYIDRHQLIVYSKDGFREWDAICNYGTYGAELGLLEIMGVLVPTGDVEGYLTADQVIEKYKAWKGVKHV